ncbi:NnrS family protein [uncultured Sneathiella sp.]|uniref:NnrS family protein n=1 Tax=uncultured Sneathiella sp. TaxID=879315 RepID=UPI0030DA287A
MSGSHRREYSGPAVLSFGFRPFFLIASIYAGVSVLLWLPLIMGHLQISSTFAPVDWHIHEMLFGFATAVVCGFLFTAVPNWTGRMPVNGMPLLMMVMLWVVGRIAVTYSAHIGWVTAMAIDCLFLFGLWVVVAREIIKGKNWKNLKILIPLSILLGSNILFHLEANIGGIADYSKRMAISAVIVFILLIGGRIIPSFTRNWLVKFNPGRLPAPFGLFEKVNLVFSVFAMGCWIVLPEHSFVGFSFCLAAALLFVQLGRWAGERTIREPLVLVLHISYMFIPIGFLLLGLSLFFPFTILPATGVHALGIGAVGGMILSVMMRATKGHTGNDLTMKSIDCLIYFALVISAVTRIISALFPDEFSFLLTFSGLLWAAAFFGFSLVYGSCLMKPKQP